jgi:putative tryptophan/tyrosine transport system substrate-binding protein
MGRKAGCWSKKIRIPGFALWALLFALCYPTAAQQQTKVSRIGFLGTQTGLRLNDRVTALQQGLRELGYVEGKNLSIEYRWANGNVEKLPSLAAELTNLNVELIIVTGGVSAIAAVRNATRTIPIVFAGSNDPVASGFVATLARPGGNLTGLTIGGPELYGKRVEILKEVVPGASRAGLLLNPMVPSANVIWKSRSCLVVPSVYKFKL